jgi:hypothetical protein
MSRQREEATWMCGKVCRGLCRERCKVPAFPVDESLMTAHQEVEIVKAVMYDESSRKGLCPLLQEEDYVETRFGMIS